MSLVVVVAAACSGGGSEEATTTTAAVTSTASGTGDTTTTEAPAEPFAAESVVAGDQHVCALTESGEAWCWGYNRAGQLGDGTGEDSDTPVAVAADAAFSQLSAGRYFTCGITTEGETQCWGDNSRGSLGNGETGAGSSDADQAAPVTVDTEVTFESIVSGQLHTCGLTEDGAAYCWGAYASGQLGNEAGEDVTTPQPSAEGLAFGSLAPGGDTSTCGITVEGEAYCWGNDSFGQLGRGDESSAPRPEPAPVTGAHEFASLTLGRTHACGIDTEGELWCWGANDTGQLGDGTTESAAVPTAVATDQRFVQVAADDGFTCAVADGGDAYCWGANVDGRLGDGTEDDSTEPVAVSGDLAFVELSAGEVFTCGVTEAGGAWCWGSNRVGWLGDGSGEDSTVPVPVAS